MESFNTWRCPGCDALVVLPTACAAPLDPALERRLDQLAQASCGCWVAGLSDRGMAKLLDAIVCARDVLPARSCRAAGRTC